jgi:hypothetical protein
MPDKPKSLYERAIAYGIPRYSAHNLQNYILHGIPTGDFLNAVLCNDLIMAVMYADPENTKLLPTYIKFLYNEVPQFAWGSPELVTKWMADRKANRMTV